jgi:hypothetical protein
MHCISPSTQKNSVSLLKPADPFNEDDEEFEEVTPPTDEIMLVRREAEGV